MLFKMHMTCQNELRETFFKLLELAVFQKWDGSAGLLRSQKGGQIGVSMSFN